MTTRPTGSTYAAAPARPATVASVDIETIVARFHNEWRLTDDPDGPDRYWWWARSVRVDPDELWADDGEGNLYVVPFSTDGEDEVTFGTPQRSRLTAVPVDAGIGTAATASVRRRRQTIAAADLPHPTFPDRPTAEAPAAAPTTTEETSMTPEEIREALGLSADATDEQVTEAMVAGAAALAVAPAEQPEETPALAEPDPAATAPPVTAAPAPAVVPEPQLAATVAAAVSEQFAQRDATAAAAAERDAYLESKVGDGTIHRDAIGAFRLMFSAPGGADAARQQIDAMPIGRIPVLQRKPGTAASTAAAAETEVPANVLASCGLPTTPEGGLTMQHLAAYKPGDNVPAFCTTQVRAGRFVSLAGPLSERGDIVVSESGAGEWPFGVAERDSAPPTEPARTMMRRVNCVRRGAIARVIAGAAVTAEQFVKSDAEGRAVVAATRAEACGQAVSSQATVGSLVLVDLF